MSSAMKSNRGSKSDAVSNYSDKVDGSKILHSESYILWPEWSDAEINSEKWGAPLKYDISGKRKSVSPVRDTKKNTSRIDNSAGKTIENEQYEDPYPVELAWSLHKGKPIYWQRPSAVFPDIKLVINTENASVCPDLITSNRKLLRSEFIRSFISSVQILTYIGYQYPFEIEWQTVQFTANTRNLPWKPWHHIYSIGRAGGTAQHSPVCNVLGKYVVRLFWLGCWRKIFVDDRFPVNSAGKPLLPTTTIENSTELELWPLLLTKALMKIASLSWTDHMELVDFDIISCLTGWAVQKLSIKGLELTEKWEICCSYSDHFTWDKNLLKDDSSAQALEADIASKDKNKGAKNNKNRKPTKANVDVSQDDVVDFHLVGTLADLRNYADILEDITPCWSHECLLESTRNVPLVKEVSDITDEFASWKEFRWIDWAIEQGLREAGFTLENKKFIKVVSSLRKIIDNNTVDLETSYKEKCIKNCVDAYAKFLEQKEAGQLGKKPVSASAITKDKSAKTPKTAKIEKFVDPSVWCYFNNIGEYINSLSIYIKPSSFSSRYVLTNFKISASPLSKKASKKDDKKSKEADTDSFKHILWENILQKTRNDTMYIFTDTIDFRLTVFTLAHIGKNFPERHKDEKLSSDLLPVDCNKTICTSGNCIDDCSCQKKDSIESLDTNFIDQRRTASIIVEDFDWTSRQTGDMSMFLKTYGTSSLFFNFARGRHVKRIWINAEPVFCLHIFSDDPNIKIGKCDEILERMAIESELLTKKCFELCSAFGDLVRYFATSNYPQALKEFYKSYLPDDIQLSKKNATRIHNCFLNEMKVILADSYPEMFHYDMSRAIRVLFLDPSFRIPYTANFDTYVPFDLAVPVNNTCPCVDTNKVNEKELDMAAIKIQSLFKMYYVKRIKDIHNINNNNLPRIIECIKSIYMDIFSSKNRDLQCMRLLRGMIFNKDIKDLIKHYNFCNDLKTVIDLKIFSGDVSEVKQIKFMPLFKRTFNCIDNDVFMRAYIYSTLPTYIVRVFNNDTGDEIDRYTNNALVHKYVKNQKGYTIFAYGASSLSASVKNQSWKLLIVSEKIYASSTIEIDSQPNSILQLEGVYVPNLDNLICKIRVKVNQNCRGTFHLQASSLKARLKMQCTSLEGNILAEAYGMSTVMIPLVNLIVEHEDANTQEVISVEKSLKQVKKMKNQRRVSSKSLTTKDRKKLERESIISIQSSTVIKKKTFSAAEYRPSIDFKEFFIRVFILENSWPLTISEWTLVNSVRNQANVEPELIPTNTSNKASSLPQKKLNLRNTPRRASKIKEVSISKPFWIFSSYCDGFQKPMNIIIDNSRLDEIREIKRQIILNDTERYLEGKEKRQEFLERSYIQWTPPKSPSVESFSDYSLLAHLDSTVEDIANKKNRSSSEFEFPLPESIIQKKISICRTCQQEFDPSKYEYLRAPESRHKMLPPFDYNKYYEKINDYRWPIDQKRENEILSDIEKEIEKFNEENLHRMESIENFLQETKVNYKILKSWYKEIREESHLMMTKNDAKREYYKEKIKEEKPGKDASKASDKSKKK